MSLLNLAKRAFTRPISSSASTAVGTAFLVLLLHKILSDHEIQQPVTTRKMHIQSIPMCESTSCVPNDSKAQSGRGWRVQCILRMLTEILRGGDWQQLCIPRD